MTTDDTFEPCWVTEIELGKKLQELSAPVPGAGGRYRRGRALVRADGEPVAFVDFDLDANGTIAAAKLETVLREHLGEGISEVAGVTNAPVASMEGLVSIVICTHDRPEMLERAITSIFESDAHDYELVIVDNAPSSDATRKVVESFEDSRLQYVVEPEASLSRARNRGALSARGEILAYTDDDVWVDARWLPAIRRGFGRAPNVALVSGLVPAAKLETPAQLYFDRRVNWSTMLEPRLYDLDQNKSPNTMYPYSAGRFGTGANFAARKDVWMALGGNDEDLGPGIMGEDLDFFLRVILSGGTIAYEPAAIVWHTHRTEMDALSGQMRAYGIALGAYTTKHVLSFSSGFQIVRRIPSALLSIRRDSKRALEATEGHVDLRRTEMRGLLSGPWRYVIRRIGRRLRRRRSLI